MQRFLFPALALIALAIVGCGGGNVVAPFTHPSPGPSAIIPVGPTPSVIVLTGDGYTLSFTLPPVVSGSPATITAVLQTNVPNGVTAPQFNKKTPSILAKKSPSGSAKKSPSSLAKRPQSSAPQKIPASLTTLVYLSVLPSATVSFASVPSFQYTLPLGTSIASGSTAYVAFYDPAQSSTGWVPVLGPGVVSGQNVTFAPRVSGVTLQGGSTYVYALIVTTTPVPTASPNPTPTAGPTATPSAGPTATPTPATLAAYCNSLNYSVAAGGVPLTITDDSGLGAVLVVYIENGTGWLSQNSTWSPSPNPLPAACFSTTRGSSGTMPLVIPTGVSGGRIYLAYATPNPNPNVIPNPLASASVSGPNVGYSNSPFPFDKLEYGTILANTPLIDTTQVDALGLPLELSVSSSTTATPMPDDTPGPCVANVPMPGVGPYGVTSCKFAAVFNSIEQIPAYSPLVYTANFNNKLIDLQVVSPSQAYQTAFDWNIFADPTTQCSGPATYGYLSCVLAAYQSTPRLFTSAVSGAGVSAPAPYYCASSDGSSNFLFTNVGTTAPASCSSATPNPNVSPNPFKMPVQLFTYATVPVPVTGGTPSPTCDGNILFSQPFGLAYVGPQQLFATNEAFAMWKALTADLNYGTTMSTTQTHPVGQVSPPPITPSGLFQDAMYNQYDKLMHDNFNGGLAYGIPYDDLYGLESGVDLPVGGGSINVRINPVPTASAAMPGSQPSQLAIPAPCPTITPGVGSY